jgi:hypothetical protein
MGSAVLVNFFVVIALLLGWFGASAVVAQTAPAPAPAEDPNEGNPCSIGWYKAHGWLLWLAFGVFFPVGTLLSRYGQYRLKWWFEAHLVLQVNSEHNPQQQTSKLAPAACSELNIFSPNTIFHCMSVLQGYQNSYMKVQGSMIMLAWILQKILYSPKTAEKTIQDNNFDFGFLCPPADTGSDHFHNWGGYLFEEVRLSRRSHDSHQTRGGNHGACLGASGSFRYQA